MTEPSPHTAVDPLDEELIAYLDGELEDAARIAVEERLTRDDDYRRRLRSLERAWDMLDFLPRAQASDGFTRSTVEMTVETAGEEAETQQLRIRRSRRFGLAVGAAAALVAVAGGYGLTSYLLDATNRELVRDLRVIENVDQYRAVEDVDFLRRLIDEGLFVEPADEEVAHAD